MRIQETLAPRGKWFPKPLGLLGLALLGGTFAANAAQGPQPTICTRACWSARAPGCTISQMASLNRAIIHHTAGSTDYSTDLTASKSKVRGIQNYHMDTQGWCDVGYHFMVDAGGNIFEGRSGSMSSLPKGSHDSANDNSFGFNIMGNYEVQSPTEASRDSLYDVIAWRMPSAWSPFGSASGYCGDEGCRTVGWLDGHNKVKSTSCPGANLYNPYITSNYSGGEARSGVNTRKNGNGGTTANLIGPDAVSWGPGRIDVVVRGGGFNIFHKYYNGSSWSPFWDLGGDSFSSPAISTWGTNRLDVFVRGGGDALYHKYFNGSDWFPTGSWENLGGTLSSGPDAVSWGNGRIDVVVRGGGNAIFHKTYANGNWGPFYNIGGNAASDPTICSWAPGRLDAFYKASSGALMHAWYTTASGAWTGWQDLGGVLNSSPEAVCWGDGRIDVVGRGGNNNIYQKIYSGGWSSWANQLGTSTSDPSISSWGPNRLDIFMRGTDNTLQHKWFNGNWSGWESLDGILY